jgi:hypothetical protein
MLPVLTLQLEDRVPSTCWCWHVNFITGANGSAILAAIQLCLGGTAKTLVRNEHKGAYGPVIVKLANKT